MLLFWCFAIGWLFVFNGLMVCLCLLLLCCGRVVGLVCLFRCAVDVVGL